MTSAKSLAIDIVSDVICPWCYIGKRRLEKALELVAGEVDVTLHWLPFQLNPGMPPSGMPREDYRRAKFGSLERSRGLDARVASEGKGVGIEFAFERIGRTPNTFPAPTFSNSDIAMGAVMSLERTRSTLTLTSSPGEILSLLACAASILSAIVIVSSLFGIVINSLDPPLMGEDE